MAAHLPRRCRLCPAPAVSRGRCAQHAPAAASHRSRFSHIYDTKQWRWLSKQHLAQRPFCVCGCGRLADLVDHRIPHRGNLKLAFDPDNLQSMARDCHGRKTADETNQRRGGGSMRQSSDSNQAGGARDTLTRRMSFAFEGW